MKIRTLVLLALFAVTTVQADEQDVGKDKEKEYQSTCPVMGGKIDKELYVDHKGKRIYACCKGCIAKVKADPEKYIEKIEESDEKVYHTHKRCKKCEGKDETCAKCTRKGKNHQHGKHHEKGGVEGMAGDCCGCGKS